jgi:hypothetical protein
LLPASVYQPSWAAAHLLDAAHRPRNKPFLHRYALRSLGYKSLFPGFDVQATSPSSLVEVSVDLTVCD